MDSAGVIPISGIDEPVLRQEAHPLPVNSTEGSILHLLASRFISDYDHGLTSAATIAFAGILFTYVPLLIAAWLSPVSLALPKADNAIRFLHDWNTAFTFLVSFPLLLTIVVRDHGVIVASLQRVRDDGVLVISDEAMTSLCASWKHTFLKVNLFAQACGVATGACLSWLMYRIYHDSDQWMSGSHHLLIPAGPVFLWCIFCLYGLIPVYAVRCIATSFFLRAVVSASKISMLPFHPDRSGGLRPVGQIGLRHQYFLSVIGINLILWIISDNIADLRNPGHLSSTHAVLHHVMLALGVCYFLLGPLIFLGPLLPFRTGMIANKTSLMHEVAQRLRIELARLHGQLRSGEITKNDEELLDRLRKIGAVIEELPIWPFDAGTVRKFLTVYVPTLTAIMATLAKAQSLQIWHWLRL